MDIIEQIEDIENLLKKDLEIVVFDIVDECENMEYSEQSLWTEEGPQNSYKDEVVKDGVEKIVEKIKLNIDKNINNER